MPGFSAVSYTHRFVGPCRSKDLQPYARPDILSVHAVYDDGIEEDLPHAILRFGCTGSGDVTLELRSDRDADFYGNWSGSREELRALVQPAERVLRLWNLTIKMSARMQRVLLDAPQ
jgi:hypothetical protein